MITITGSEQFPADGGIVATIGFFDGVHIGHRHLINQLKETGRKRNLPTAVITFPEHPRSVLHSSYQPKLLNLFDEKINQLRSTDIDYCILLNFTPELSQLTAAEFMSTVLSEQFHVKTLLIGYDHHFGHDKKDDFTQYIQLGKEVGIEVIPATPYHNGETSVSSSVIRRLLEKGEIEKVNDLLSYPYALLGTVTSGHQIGRKLGFPTANIHLNDTHKLIPKTGVYAVWVIIDDTSYKGMLYIGDRPTLENGENVTIEVNIFNFSEDIYHKEISVIFDSYIRDNKKFDSLEELQQQLVQDKEAVEISLKDKEL